MDIRGAVRAALPLIKAEADASEQAGTLTEPVVATMRDAGVFRMTMSAALGGPELSPLEQIAILEELASADGSAGWCGMINSDGGYVTSFLEPAVAKEMYPSLDAPTSVVANPSGQARREGDGYRVDGQWGFASGSRHCQWFFLNCLVFDGDTMTTGDDGFPLMRMVAVPAAEVEILDTWHTTGLAGTASNDVRVAGAFVPAERTFNLFADAPVDPSPLYQWTWMFFVNVTGVPLGIARAAIDEAVAVASTKVTMPSFALARDDATVQFNVGRAQALVRSARAYADDAAGGVWDALLSGRPPSPEEWLDVRLSLTNAAHASKEAVNLLYEALGTTGVYRRSPLDRHLRDLTTMAQHILMQTKTYAAGGRRLLGIDPAMIAF
jgi:alkylation response protein AidB-like acyl-CoA dehydrogenase